MTSFNNSSKLAIFAKILQSHVNECVFNLKTANTWRSEENFIWSFVSFHLYMGSVKLRLSGVCVMQSVFT